MCGIAGFQGEFAPALVDRMVGSLAHRGPDSVGAAILSPAHGVPTALGHCRLAIIDLSDSGRQPMSACPDVPGGMQTGLTLVYNGEIYNYRELRTELEAEGHRFRSATDTEVLLHLYERDGLSMLDCLNGIFAFAIHDNRAAGRPVGVGRGSLFLARDQFGVKPLYYAATTRGFIFGSEIKALMQEPSMPTDLDLVALHQTLAYLWTPAPRTGLAAARKLEPGCAMLVDGGRVRRHWRYYELPYDGSPVTAPECEVAEELRSLVEAGVRRQMISDVPLGAFLSGGVDSSAVVSMMRRVVPHRALTCFVADPGGDMEGAPADIPYARQVAAHLGVTLVEVDVSPSSMAPLGEIVGLLDEPQADPASVSALLIAKRARQMGIPVLLSGVGGDDLFSGYRRHRALIAEGYWRWLPRPARHMLQAIARTGADGYLRGQSIPVIRRAAKMFANAAEPQERRMVSYFWWGTERLRRSLYSPEFAACVAQEDTATPLLDSLRGISRERDSLQRMLFLETRHFLADHNLNYTDRAGMASGVEIRVPLLDRDLVAFAARVPSSMKQRGSVGKAIFKKAMEPLLPPDVITRPKTGFGVPLRRWLAGSLRPMVDEVLSARTLTQRGLFDPARVSRLIDLDRRGAADGAHTIFALVCIELWCRRFVDGQRNCS